MKPLVVVLFMSVVFAGALIEVSTATDYTVTWSLTSNANAWGESQKFTVGDTITFVYEPFHDVLEVSETAYESCSAANPLSSYTGGRTTVALTAPGDRYFICGVPGHCPLMKLAVDVASSSSSPQPPPPSPPPPPPPPPPSPSPPPPSSSPPPPPQPPPRRPPQTSTSYPPPPSPPPPPPPPMKTPPTAPPPKQHHHKAPAPAPSPRPHHKAPAPAPGARREHPKAPAPALGPSCEHHKAPSPAPGPSSEDHKKGPVAAPEIAPGPTSSAAAVGHGRVAMGVGMGVMVFMLAL